MKIGKYTEPYDHWVIDDFLDIDLARVLASQFPSYDSPDWLFYDNPLEHKKALNHWHKFPKETYAFLAKLNSPEYLEELKLITGLPELYPDLGLHGAGWHIHGNHGKLNVHMDYSIHPKLNLLRKFNLIIYLSEDWQPEWGGNLELWSHDPVNNLPKDKVVTLEQKFNRAVLIDASQNSWHGFYDKIVCPEDKYRKSIACYYHAPLTAETPIRNRALYSPSPEQRNDPAILKLIADRSA